MTTPDHPPAPARPEYNTEERAVTSLDQLEQWRQFQNADLMDRRTRSGYVPPLDGTYDPFTEPTYLAEFRNGISSSLDDYLNSQGLPIDSPNRDEVKALFRDASIDNVNDKDWNDATIPAPTPGEPDRKVSPRQQFEERIRERLEAGATAPTPDDDEAERLERERIINEARAAVEAAREDCASVSSRRQGKVLGRNVKGQADVYSDYHAKVNNLGRLELADVLADDAITPEDKNVQVIEYLFKEQVKLRELTTEKLQNTKVSKFITWMNKGGIVKRILKGGALGLAAAGAGAFLAGAAGAGVLAGGAVVASRFIRGFALGDKDRRGMAVADESMKGEIANRMDGTDADNAFDEASQHFDVEFENDTRKEQNQRRKAAIVGLGVVAVGAGAGMGIHAAAEAAAHHGFQLWHPFGGGHHSTGPDNGHQGGANAADSKGTGGHDGGGSGHDGQHGAGGHDTQPGAKGHDVQQGIDTGSHLPGSHGYAYPWNWAHDAAPKGVNPETWLHTLGDKAAAAGHNVQWHHGAGDIEWLSVDGKSATGPVIDTLRQYAK